MTQEDKNLLLKDLCGRIPYRVKCISGVDDKTLIIEGINLNSNGASQIQVTYECSGINFDTKISTIKPYLFPLSSMTLEQRCKVQNLLPDKCEVSFVNSEISFYGEDYHKIKLEQFEKLFNLFNMWHVDYRGLIPKGLANNATGLGVY